MYYNCGYSMGKQWNTNPHTDIYDLTLQTGDTVRFSGSKYTWEIVKFRGDEALLMKYGNVFYSCPCDKLLKVKT